MHPVAENFHYFIATELKLQELAEKIASRELEAIDVLSDMAALTTE